MGAFRSSTRFNNCVVDDTKAWYFRASRKCLRFSVLYTRSSATYGLYRCLLVCETNTGRNEAFPNGDTFFAFSDPFCFAFRFFFFSRRCRRALLFSGSTYEIFGPTDCAFLGENNRDDNLLGETIVCRASLTEVPVVGVLRKALPVCGDCLLGQLDGVSGVHSSSP